MRRSLSYLAMAMVLIGGALVAISDERWQSDGTLEPLLSLLSPARVHAADGAATSSDDEMAAYYQADSDADTQIRPVSNPAPATNTSSRRTQLDARFEDMSLSLAEDESEEFRDKMVSPPATMAELPSVDAPTAARPEMKRPNTASILSAMPPSLAPIPEEPEHAAIVSDDSVEAAPSPEPVPMFEIAPAQPATATPVEATPVTATPPAAAPAQEDRSIDSAQRYTAEQPTRAETLAPVEATRAPFGEPRRLSSENTASTTASETADEPQPGALFAEPAKRVATSETPTWNAGAKAPAHAEVFAAPSATSDKKGAGAVSVHWLTPGEVDRGDEIPCRLQVTNEGDAPAVAVAVHVELPEHAELASVPSMASTEGRGLSWKLDRLEPQESKTFELRLLPKGEGDFAPTASVTYTRAATASIHVLDPQLAVSIEGPEQALVSQPAMYQLRVSNPGTGKARNVVVQARLDARLSHPAGNELEYSIGTLGPGETRLLEVPVTGNTPGEGTILAEATSANRLSAQGGCAVEIVRPALQIAIDGPKLRFVDRKAVFTLTAYNPGAVAATNVQIFGSVPAGYKYQSATAGGGYDESMSAVAWFVGRLEPQATAKVEYELVAHELGDHRVLAMVRADLGVEERTELDTTIDGVPSVALEMSSPDAPIEVGGQATYRIEVTNRGTKEATDVQVACRVPAEMEATDAKGATLGAISADRIVFEPLAILAPGETKVYEVHVTCRQAGDVRFRSFFRSNECREVVQQEALTRIYQD